MKLLIATPCFGRLVHLNYVSSLVGLVQYLEINKTPFDTVFLGNESVIQRARNDYVHYALSSDYTHILFIDSDMGFEWEDFSRLREAKKRIVSGLCPKKKYPLEYVFSLIPGEAPVPDQTGLLEVRSASIAFCLIDLEVLREYSDLAQTYLGVSSITGRAEKLKNWFPAGPDKNGVFQSEDHGFFALMREAGEPIYLHTKVKLTHQGQHVFGKDAAP